MHLNRTDINGFEPKIGDVIGYFKPIGGSYQVYPGVIVEIGEREIVADTKSSKQARIRTGLYVILSHLEQQNNPIQLGAKDIINTSICIGDTLISATMFNIYDAQGYSKRRIALVAGEVVDPTLADRRYFWRGLPWTPIRVQRVIAVVDPKDLYRYETPTSQRLIRAELSSEDIYESDQTTPNARVRNPHDYKRSIRLILVNLDQALAMKLPDNIPGVAKGIRDFRIQQRLKS